MGVDVDRDGDLVPDLKHIHKADRFCPRSPYCHVFAIFLEFLQAPMPRSDTLLHFRREPVDQSGKVVEGLGRGLGVGDFGREATVDAEKLFFIGFLDSKDFEASSLEKVYEGLAAEVVAVLVNDIPDRKTFEDEPDVGDFEVDDCVCVASNRFADRSQKLERVFDVFKDVAATYQVARLVGVFLPVEILHVLDATGDRTIDSFSFVAWIEADPGILAALAEKGEEVPLAAAQFDDSLSANRIGFDESVGQTLSVSLKHRREVERVVILLRILEQTFIEGAIPNEAA